jgi:hypothetical protein
LERISGNRPAMTIITAPITVAICQRGLTTPMTRIRSRTVWALFSQSSFDLYFHPLNDWVRSAPNALRLVRK